MVYSHLISNSVNDPLLPTAFITDSTLYLSLESARDKDSIFCKIITINTVPIQSEESERSCACVIRSFDFFASVSTIFPLDFETVVFLDFSF